MIKVPVGNVEAPRHLSAFVSRDLAGNNRARMDVFTGWVGVNFRGDGGAVHRDNFESFLLTDSKAVHTFTSENDILDVTVTVAPSSVADDDDEANVAAVDTASVRLEPQVFGGIAGTPLCLILRGKVAALNATVHAVTYQVTVLSRPTDTPERDRLITLDRDAAPA